MFVSHDCKGTPRQLAGRWKRCFREGNMNNGGFGGVGVSCVCNKGDAKCEGVMRTEDFISWYVMREVRANRMLSRTDDVRRTGRAYHCR